MDSVRIRNKEDAIKVWSNAMYLEALRPSWYLAFTDPSGYEKELKVYKKVRSIQRIKRQAFFM